MTSKNCKKTTKTFNLSRMNITFQNSEPSSETALLTSVGHMGKDELIFLKKLEKLIEAKDKNKIINLAAMASELPVPIKNPAFYKKALDYLKKQPIEKVYLHIESLGQSAAIAKVQDEDLYFDIVDVLLTNKNKFGFPIISQENINSVCRVLASIEISNEKLENDHIISANKAFRLAIDKLLESEIENERRMEEKADRLVEIYEQALAAKINPECGREFYEKVFEYIIENPKLSLEYKMKTIFEITKKAIKMPGLVHTSLFIRSIDFYKKNNAGHISRTLMHLIYANKK